MKTRRKIKLQFESPKHDEESSISEQHSLEEADQEDTIFPLTRTIQNMLYVYGDQRRSEVNNLAHLQIQELISDIFQPQILYALYQPPSKPWESIPTDIKFTLPLPTIKYKRILQNYLYFVFKEFVNLYQRLSRISKPLERQKLERIQKNDVAYEEIVKQKAQKMNLIYEEEQFSQGENSASNASLASESPHSVWEQYLKDRVERMQSKEFVTFMELRSKTFIHHQQFKQFIDPHQYGPQFIELINLKFLNYCLCRVLKRIIQKVMQQEPPKPQQFQLKEEHLKKIGYQIIETYKIRAKKFALQDFKLNEMAYKLFLSEFTTQGYDAYFQSRMILGKNGKLSSNQEVRAQEEWEKMGAVRQKWIDRVKAEKQVRQKLLKKKDVTPNNQYSKVLLQKVENLTYEQAKMKFTSVFKEWFIHLETVEEIDSIYD